MHVLGLEFGSAAQMSKRPGSVRNCLWGHALKRSPGIIHTSRVSYLGPGFLPSATWPSLLKKHYNVLNQTKPKPISHNENSPASKQGSPFSKYSGATTEMRCVNSSVNGSLDTSTTDCNTHKREYRTRGAIS